MARVDLADANCRICGTNRIARIGAGTRAINGAHACAVAEVAPRNIAMVAILDVFFYEPIAAARRSTVNTRVCVVLIGVVAGFAGVDLPVAAAFDALSGEADFPIPAGVGGASSIAAIRAANFSAALRDTVAATRTRVAGGVASAGRRAFTLG